jgi:predicted transcriptional regulator with HTH domain
MRERINDCHSVFYSFIYQFNKLYKQPLAFDNSGKGSFFDEIARRKNSPANLDSILKHLTVVTEGFHSFTNLNRVKKLKLHSGINIFLCIIPKGSEYFEDKSNLCVSNKIKVIKPI